MSNYYHPLQKANYDVAKQALWSSDLLKADRNKLLYYVENGMLFHLNNEYDSSNMYFNHADNFVEDYFRHNTADFAKSYLLNPMVQTYLGEDFEHFLVHYYKAMNYTYLKRPDDALVEARRISLATTIQQDKFKTGAKRYTEDAFMLMLQGLLYESRNQINDAFISYRNAADIYLKQPSKTYYGVTLPLQLQKDLLRTASQMGFTNIVQQYQQKLTIGDIPVGDTTKDNLIIFIEQGWAPIKQQRDIVLTKSDNGATGFYYVDSDGNTIFLPFNIGGVPMFASKQATVSSFRMFRVALPYYKVVSPILNHTQVTASNGLVYTSEKAEDINTIAVKTLDERMSAEIIQAIVRLVVKKLTEMAAQEVTYRAAGGGSGNSNHQNDAQAIGAVVGLLANAVNTATEKADTRNWQSLPAAIDYVKIPLKPGINDITLNYAGYTTTIQFDNKGGLQFYEWKVGK